MFSFFKKKVDLVTDISWLGVDMHSHLLPGIDDGSPNVLKSVELIRKLKALGFGKLVCTPHIFVELYPNTPETIVPALDATKAGLKEAAIDIVIEAAAEYMVDECFSVQDTHLCLAGGYILIEMSYLNETPNIEQIIFELQIKGYKVILAHPERYNFYHSSTHRLRRFKDMGVLFQLNLLSVTGYYGKEVKASAENLLNRQCYDLAGTDLHNGKHLDALEKSIITGFLYKKIGQYPFKNKKLFS